MDSTSSANTNPSFVDMINILVVDDDATTLAIVSAMLKTWSYQVVSVRNPIDALATLRARKGVFDLVVTDLHMPQMNGFELQKHVREEFKLPVIMMSADDKESVILKSLEGGVVYYIVKPVSKDDIMNVWQYAVAAKKGKSVALEEIESAPREALGEIEDGISETTSNVNEEKLDKKAEAKIKKGRKRSREDDNEERLVAPKKQKVVWTNSLHNQFLLAIRYIGLDKAVPKRILESMNVPGLTRENVASHLQKYRIFLKRVADKARLSKCLSERVFRSSFAFGHHDNVERDHYYSQFLKQQQMKASVGPTFQPLAGIGDTQALTAAAFNNVGSIHFPSQLASSSRSAVPQLIRSGQSRLLNPNQANNILRQQSMLGNGNQLLCKANSHPAAFGMQQLINNTGNGGMSYGGLMNNVTNNIGLTNNNNIGTNNLMKAYPPQSQPRQQYGVFTNYPFRSNFSTSGNQNSSSYTPLSPSFENMGSFNNVNQLAPNPSFQLSGNFAGTQMMSSDLELAGMGSQPAGMFNNITNNINMGLGGGYQNGITNSLTNGVHNVNLTDVPMGNSNGNTNSGYMAQLGASSSMSSAGFESSSSSAYPFLPNLAKNNDRQQTISLLPQPAENNNQHGLSNINVGGGNVENSDSTGVMNNTNTTAAPTLINNNNISHEQDLVSDDIDDLMISNLFMDQQNNYEPPPSQQLGAGDQLPPDFSSFLNQVELPDTNATEAHMNPAEQVPNPNSSGPGHVEDKIESNEQSWSQQVGGDQHVLNPEFSSNLFESEDYNILFDPQHPFQDCDDDFISAIFDAGL